MLPWDLRASYIQPLELGASYIKTQDLGASYIPPSDLETSYIPPQELGASYIPPYARPPSCPMRTRDRDRVGGDFSGLFKCKPHQDAIIFLCLLN